MARRRWKFSWLCFLGVFAALAAFAADPATSVPSPANPPLLTNADEVRRIEQALPAKALVAPRQPRRLLMFDLNVGYGGHGSIPHANQAFLRMGQATGAYATEVSHDPAVFAPESLRRFDAVCFNNTVGNLFTNAALRQSLIEFVVGGGGLLGLHGTSVAFTRWPGAIEDWPEFGVMLGARGANHRDSNEPVWIKLDDPAHPLNRLFGGQGFEYRDEFFRFQDPYSRQRVRVLFSIDLEKTDATQGGAARGNAFRADNDYALAWIRNYGRGRVFYCTIAHNPSVFWDAKLLEFYFGAIQFALGDLPAPTTPSAQLTPAKRAQEKLDWRLEFATTRRPLTLFEAIDQAAALGLSYVGGSATQAVSRDLPKPFDPRLTADEQARIRLKLDATGVRLLTYSAATPSDEPACRALFEFGRRMGVETFLTKPSPRLLDVLERLCDEHNIQLALRTESKRVSPDASPDRLRRLCQNRSPRIGVCGDVGVWLADRLDPIRALGTLRDRLLVLELHDQSRSGNASGEAPWGTGVGRTAEILREVRQLERQPRLFRLDYASMEPDPTSDLTRCIDFFNQQCLQLTEK